MSVDLVHRKFDDEEIAFIKKYGEKALDIWESLSESQKANYIRITLMI